MTRARRGRFMSGGFAGNEPVGDGSAPHRAKIAEDDRKKIAHDIGWQTLELAKRARAADLPLLGYLLETAAFEAAAGPWPGDEN